MRTQFPQPFRLRCPYQDLSELRTSPLSSPKTHRLVRKGRYWRAEDSRWISRWKCLNCRKSFSSSRLTPCFRQKKRKLNHEVYELFVSGVSQRRVARLLQIDRKTVVRKFLFLAAQARTERFNWIRSLGELPEEKKIQRVYFDEMESFERSKCLPLSIPLAVLPEQRKILSFRVGRMPSKGPLARISFRKYGPRADDRPEIAQKLWREIRPTLVAGVEITTDQNPRYPGWIRPHFSREDRMKHRTVKGRRGCVVGQGELKRIGWDPLFDLNHTCAMIRANINRLFRRTWCTTKRADRLEAHLEIYAHYHNRVLTAKAGG